MMQNSINSSVDADGLLENSEYTENLHGSIDPPPNSEPPSPVSPALLFDKDKTVSSRKKKKKRAKKPVKPKDDDTDAHKDDSSGRDTRPPVLCISRNKHWKYISSYHGPWLQLPLELLESLLVLNLDPATVSTSESRISSLPSTLPPSNRTWNTGFASLGNTTQPDSTDSLYAPVTVPPFPTLLPGKAAPPPIDPGVFRSVTTIRKLIDEAAELSVRASSGLSAAALGSMRGANSLNLSGSPWSAMQSLGINPLNDFGGGGGGRNFTMSAARVHRLRLLAVQKLAAAYKADEIASSVMVMQGGSVFDDIAEKILKSDPNNIDARYVHFFHEKIPSRQLAESTPTTILDQLIAENPQRLEFYRTRGIVHCFRDEYALAVKDFTIALKEARAIRKARQAHDPAFRSNGENHPKGKRKKSKINGQAPPSGTAAAVEGPDGEPLLIHPSTLSDAPDPLEPQVLFHRGAAFLAHAIFLIEDAIYKIEGIQKVPPNDVGELRLNHIEQGKYGGTEVGNPDGPLGSSDGPKCHAYRVALGEKKFREQVYALLKKSKRDHEKFLSHFDTLEAAQEDLGDDLLRRTERAFLLLETFRPTTRAVEQSPLPDVPLSFTTYHPLMVESHFSILISILLLGEIEALVYAFEKSANLVAGLEGYPIFLPPRSMAQAEFIEVLDRLAGGWKFGKIPDALTRPTLQLSKAAVRPSLPPLSPLIADDEATVTASSAGPSTATSIVTPSQSGRGSPASDEVAQPIEGQNLRDSLELLRVLLAPLAMRQREKEKKTAQAKAGASDKDKRKPAPINLALHGTRVDVMLAWLGAVHLPELENVASL